TFVMRQAVGGTAMRYVLEHLIGFGPDNINGTVADLDWWARCPRLLPKGKERRQRRRALIDNRLHQLHRTFVRRAADIARADVVIIRKDTGQITVGPDSFGPIFLSAIAPQTEFRGARRIGT